jgi:hypothetical protein
MIALVWSKLARRLATQAGAGGTGGLSAGVALP